jgi:DNA-directed RNA polymerase specialized sigma24 family protein
VYSPDKNPPPFAFIQRHYRDPGGDDPIKRWLPHPENARAICGALLTAGLPKSELEDALQNVYVKALTAFRESGTPVPGDLRAMKVYCAAIARNYVIDELRKAAKRERDGDAGLCENPSEYGPLEYGAPRRDPLDARPQLEVLVQLFREGRMPEHGWEILERFAIGRSYKQIGRALRLTPDAVEGRMRMMRDRYRSQMAKLGLLPNMLPLHVIVRTPSAVEMLRRAA